MKFADRVPISIARSKRWTLRGLPRSPARPARHHAVATLTISLNLRKLALSPASPTSSWERYVDLEEAELRATIGFEGLASDRAAEPANAILADVPGFTVSAPIRLARRGAELRFVLQGAAAPSPKPDAQLIQAVIEARCWAADFIENSGRLNVSDLARRDDAHPADVSRCMQLGFLAPEIVERLVDGTHPVSLTSETLKRIGELPLAWDEQRTLLA